MHTASPEQSLKLGKQALAIAERIHWLKGQGLALNEIGTSYLNTGNYPLAIDNYFKSLHIHEGNGDSTHVCNTLGNIGSAYFFQHRYEQALQYFSRSLSLARFTKQEVYEQNALGNLGSVYYQLGNYSASEAYLLQALRLAESRRDSSGIINQLSNLANIYAETGNYSKSLEASYRTIDIAKALNNKLLITANTGNIGETYLDMVRDTSQKLSPRQRKDTLKKAIAYLSAGIHDGRALGFRDAVIDFLKTLSEAYAAQGDYRNALFAFQRYMDLRDSTFNLANSQKIASLENSRVLQLKDRDLQIAKLELQQKLRQRWFFLAGLVLLVIIVALLWRNISRQRRSNLLLNREKIRSDNLLRNILPDEVAEELKENGIAEARQYDEVSVMFTDFVNFTRAAQQLPAKELVKELHECFSAFDEIMERHGLEKIKTIGDAYMAVCGLPIPNAEHAKNAIDAAREILRFTEERARTKPAFAVRIGIHSGPVVAGIVGTKKFAFDIWGDTVNTAARMEQSGVPGAINISETTYQLLKDYCSCTYRGRVAAKHKGEVDMYLVKAADS
ncbi:MAG: tetratricopeptide repeat protein [Bacteroidetes bacterium]|nr:tetratricopeptide repeat protein [Bacteroidota bacterium]